ncbi:MAG: hypothetical protein R3C97_02910 [Geminicoccaceae bacterium]
MSITVTSPEMPFGGEDPALVLVEFEMPDAAAREDIVEDLEGFGIDHGHMVGRSERDEGAFAVGGDRMPTGWILSGRKPLISKEIFATSLWSEVSNTVTVPPISELTQR